MAQSLGMVYSNNAGAAPNRPEQCPYRVSVYHAQRPRITMTARPLGEELPRGGNGMKIHYTTDDPSQEYGKAIRAAKNKEELLQTVTLYKEVADDAVRAVQKMSDKDFVQFKKDLPKLKRENLPREQINELLKKWGDIAIPRKMVLASLIAFQFHAPWGYAFIRLQETGWIA